MDVVDEAVGVGLDAILINSSLNKDKKTNVPRFDNWESIYKYIDKKYNN